MKASHICFDCRQRIAQLRKISVSHSQPKATFISFRTKPEPTTGNGGEGVARTNTAERKQDYGNGSSRERACPVPLRGQQRSRQLESLFEQTSQQLARAAVLDATEPTETDGATLTSLYIIRQLEKLTRARDVSATWKFFVQSFGPGAHGAHKLNRRIKEIAWTLIRDVRNVKKQSDMPELPSGTAITKLYHELGILHGADWCDLMLTLLGDAANIREKNLEDALGMFNLVCRRRNPNTHLELSDTLPMDWSKMPDLPISTILNHCEKRPLSHVFGLLMPTLKPIQLQSLPLVSVAMYTLLCDLKDQAPFAKLLRNAAPLESALSKIITACTINDNGFPRRLGEQAGPVSKYIQKNSEIVTNSLQSSSNAIIRETRRKATHPITTKRPRHLKFLFFHKCIRDALTKRNIDEMNMLWDDASKFPIDYSVPEDVHQEGENGMRGAAPQGVLNINLANYFILCYMALGRPDRAVMVWNHMVTNKLLPTLTTWDAMMVGCKKARSTEALEGVWDKLIASGTEPDTVCWTTRISGLFAAAPLDQAMHALNEMGRLWIEEAQRRGKASAKQLKGMGNINGKTKPCVETINAAISGTLKRRRPELAQEILSWAGKFGITPDVTTYNTLLRPLVRERKITKIIEILKHMQVQGICADVATFTTILDETFCNCRDQTSEQRMNTIDDVFAQFESLGIRPDLHTYNKLIFQLLNTGGEATFATVQSVLEKMSAQGINPSPHIYTMLLQHFFDQDPPNVTAVEALIQRALLVDGSVDHIFWDRVVEEYARARDTNMALRIFNEQFKDGNKASWLTLSTLLAGLVNNEDWEGASKLVSATKVERGGPLPIDVHGMQGQHAFWDFVEELQL